MKKFILLSSILVVTCLVASAQVKVPEAVKNANSERYPETKNFHVTWEKENGNYEANWGGKDGEANSVQYTLSGEFIEIVKAIPIEELPASIAGYVKEHYKTRITEAGKVTDAKGNTFYEVEVKGKDIVFTENGQFLKEEK